MSVAYAADWNIITTFTGAADQTTDNFHVPTSEWRIVWSITPDPENPDAVFLVLVRLKGESWDLESIATDGRALKTNGILYVHEGVEDYYLEIVAANLEGYTLRVEYDKTASTAATPPGDTSTPPSDFTPVIIAAILTFIAVGSLMAVVYIRRKRKQAA